MDMELIADPPPQKSTNVRPEKPATKAKVPPQLAALRAGLGVLGALAPSGAAAIAEHLFLTPKRHPRPASELEVLATGRHLLVPSPDGPLASWEWGHEGPRVLLVHGWEGRGAQLGSLVAPLAAQGFRVITFDAPAHGNSPGSEASIVHFARAIHAVSVAYGPLEAIITHSMGGASTAWAFKERPLAKRLVMICPPIDVRDFTRQLSATLSLNDNVREAVEARLARRLGVNVAELHVETLAKTMQTPLLLIHDEGDREVPIRCSERIAASWPGAELVRTQGLGHRRILKDPSVLDRAVSFVAKGT
jgi:pimeloyl-ACP methyl ester carboxylesterase